jgi:hypothetical protein
LPSLLSELRSHTSSLAEGEERGDLILHIHSAPLSLKIKIALLGSQMERSLAMLQRRDEREG